MNLKSLESALEERGIDPSWYCLGGTRGEAICILSEGDGWHVFLCDRGQRVDEATFLYQDEACHEVLGRVVRLSGEWEGPASDALPNT